MKFRIRKTKQKSIIDLLDESILQNDSASIKCTEDAGRSEIQAIRNNVNENENVAVVSEDIEVLFVLIALAGGIADEHDFFNKDISFLKPKFSKST